MIDAGSAAVMSALVVIVCAVVFIAGALVRRDDRAGAIWSVAYIGAVVTTISYALWAEYPTVVWLIAVGDAAFVAGTGCLWLGACRFNGRSMLWRTALVLIATGGTVAAVLAERPRADGWQGALVMFASLILLAAAGAIESLRGELLRRKPAWSLAFVLALQALYYISRTTAFLVVGPDSALFTQWFGTVTTSVVLVILIIVATVSTSVLLAERSPERAPLTAVGEEDEIVSAAAFDAALHGVARRASWRRELVVVVSVRIDDLEQISTAFGGDVAQAVVQAWRAAVRRYAPAAAIVGVDGETGMVVAYVAESASDARRRASVVYRGVFDELGRVSGGVIPVLGVGVGLSSAAGYDAEALVRSARDAARRASASVESSVLIGGA
ncbi:hypothetical protein [Microbacterium candidum]|uniref:GGDEF domain-containing protein n=1 Tax=Microbacterium candidum TaxID=3041922 RepID=A0ABT7MZP1_9MICO|nr:hypothetical protein [Microbacterium sp. ASV49]MDL9979923.1 hypothetical protein [Microbacterium sp. ASV49]